MTATPERKMIGTISLEGVEFYAFHGVYEEERRIGNRYLIDIAIDTDISQAGKSDNLGDTVDYQRVYQLIEVVMQRPSALLEHIAKEIIDSVKSVYPAIEAVKVKVSKLNPPIGAICKSSSVTLRA